eukprot:11188550-Alexandrium_andersonii.AAC.1
MGSPGEVVDARRTRGQGPCHGSPGQGDPWGPLALLAVMAAPTLMAERQLGPDLAQAVYLDDRTGFAATLARLRE